MKFFIQTLYQTVKKKPFMSSIIACTSIKMMVICGTELYYMLIVLKYSCKIKGLSYEYSMDRHSILGNSCLYAFDFTIEGYFIGEINTKKMIEVALEAPIKE